MSEQKNKNISVLHETGQIKKEYSCFGFPTHSVFTFGTF